MPPVLGAWSLNHWTAREVLPLALWLKVNAKVFAALQTWKYGINTVLKHFAAVHDAKVNKAPAFKGCVVYLG